MENKRIEFKKLRNIGAVILLICASIAVLGQFIPAVSGFLDEQLKMVIFFSYAAICLIVVGQCTLGVIDGKIQDTVLKKGLITGSVFFAVAAVLAFLAILNVLPSLSQSVLLGICLFFGAVGLLLILNTLSMVSTFSLMLREQRQKATQAEQKIPEDAEDTKEPQEAEESEEK